MKKATFLSIFIGSFVFAQNPTATAIDYYINYPDGFKYPARGEMVAESVTDAESASLPTIVLSDDQKAIESLKTQVDYLQSQINGLKFKDENKSKLIYAGCITSVTYLEMDLRELNNNIQNYQTSIKIVKDRNLLKKPEFASWLTLYTNFIQRQSDITVDFTSLLNLSTTSVVDFLVSTVASVLSNSSSSRELKRSSAAIFRILQDESEFYNKFESQIELKYAMVSVKYSKVSEDLKKFKIGKENMISNDLNFNPYQPYPFVENINKHISEKSQSLAGLDQLRDDKIKFYTLLQDYFTLKEDFRSLNKSFRDIAQQDIQTSESENSNVIESQLKKVFLILTGI